MHINLLYSGKVVYICVRRCVRVRVGGWVGGLEAKETYYRGERDQRGKRDLP